MEARPVIWGIQWQVAEATQGRYIERKGMARVVGLRNTKGTAPAAGDPVAC